MSNFIPPLLSDSPPPPPLTTDDDDEDDEFGHFGRSDESFAYGCDDLSLPSSPINLPEKDIGLEIKLDFNSNSKENVNNISENILEVHKDYHDKRKEDLQYVTNRCNETDIIDNNVNINRKKESEFETKDPKVDSEVDLVYTVPENPTENVENKAEVDVDSLGNPNICSNIKEAVFATNIDREKGNGPKADSEVGFEATIPKGPTDNVEVENLEVDSDSLSNSNTCSDSRKDVVATDKNIMQSTNDISEHIENKNEAKISFVEDSEKTNSDGKKVNQDSKELCNQYLSHIDGDNNCEFESDKITPNYSMNPDLSAAKSVDEFDTNFGAVSYDIQKVGSECNSEDRDPTTLQPILRDSIEDEVPDESLEISKSVSKIQELYSGQFTVSKNNLNSEEPEFDDFCAFNSNNQVNLHSLEKNSKNEDQNFANFDDGFGDFSSSPENVKITDPGKLGQSKKSEEVANLDDDFGDFASTNNVNESNPQHQSQDMEDEFGVFASTTNDTNPSKIDDKFGDFCSTTTNFKSEKHDQTEDDDEFGEFSDFTHKSTVDFSSMSGKNLFTNSEHILKDIFPKHDESDAADFKEHEKYVNDLIFLKLKDITETNAMSYVWLKSAGQNLLLKSMNIDVRNILFGPSWNPSMPRFAANLTLAPLEPIKSNASVQSSVSIDPSNDSSQASNQKPEIPTAEFDWSGAGLTNPFDYSQTVLLDLENLVSQLDLPNFNLYSSQANSPSPVAELDEWDYWLQTQLSKKSDEDLKPEATTVASPSMFPESINELSLSNPDPISEDFTQYASYESSPYHVPLRETHIHYKHTFIESDGDGLGWLKPTILTPEVSRKNSQTIEINDDLYNFGLTDKFVENSQQQELKEVISLSDDTKVEFALMPHVVKPKIEHPGSSDKQESKSDDEFDEFSEFQAAPLPPQNQTKPSKLEIVIPVVKSNLNDTPGLSSPIEPLKPSILHPQKAGSAQISWPDPGGISDEDIRKFEGIYSRPLPESSAKPTEIDKRAEIPTKENIIVQDEWSDFASSDDKSSKLKDVTFTTIFEAHTKKSVNDSDPKQDSTSIHHKPISKQSSIEKKTVLNSPPASFKIPKIPVKTNSLEDEEWSEFVSVKTQSPAHKRVTGTESRSSTPDLPLSVLNLGNIQPAKQPIPVITPQGLIQTKLSSGNVLNIQSVMQNNFHQQPSVGKPTVPQPSLISNVFANQAYGGFNSQSSMPVTKLGNSQEDDEWSDFVSHQAPPNVSQPKPTKQLPQQRHNASWFGQTNQSSSWFASNSSNNHGTMNHNMSNGALKNDSVIQSRKNHAALNISIPELDFVAPKSRTFNRK